MLPTRIRIESRAPNKRTRADIVSLYGFNLWEANTSLKRWSGLQSVRNKGVCKFYASVLGWGASTSKRSRYLATCLITIRHRRLAASWATAFSLCLRIRRRLTCRNYLYKDIRRRFYPGYTARYMYDMFKDESAVLWQDLSWKDACCEAEFWPNSKASRNLAYRNLTGSLVCFLPKVHCRSFCYALYRQYFRHSPKGERMLSSIDGDLVLCLGRGTKNYGFWGGRVEKCV